MKVITKSQIEEKKQDALVLAGYAPKYKIDRSLFSKTPQEKEELKKLKKAWKANQSI